MCQALLHMESPILAPFYLSLLLRKLGFIIFPMRGNGWIDRQAWLNSEDSVYPRNDWKYEKFCIWETDTTNFRGQCCLCVPPKMALVSYLLTLTLYKYLRMWGIFTPGANKLKQVLTIEDLLRRLPLKTVAIHRCLRAMATLWHND